MSLRVPILSLVAATLLAGCGYQAIPRGENAVTAAWAEVENQYQRRADLVPNLVSTVKGAAAHERETLEAVVSARNAAVTAERAAAANPGDPRAMQGLASAEGALSGSLSRLLAVAEAYPDLKANTNMLALQEELTSTENRISFARQAYNDAVMAYNNARETFPGALLAGGFPPATLFELQVAAEREPVQVKF